MLRIQATIGVNTYYFASEALDYADRYWEPRISNAFQISREFNSADKTGNKIRSVDVSLDNRDGFFNSIYTADGLVNGKFVLYFNEGDNNVKTFTGRVNKINSFGDDVSLTIREVGYEYLTRKFPDAQIAYDYYSTSGINESWNAIPIHLGTVNRYPCPWVNLFYSHFIIGSGPIHAVKKIYFDKTVVYDSSTGQNGYKPTPESPEIKFRIFKGARAGQTDVVDGITSPYPGFAYIQLYKIVNSVEEPADPVNPDGEAVQIYVDIEGLQNEAGNGPERNPAQILYQFFTKPYTAEEGYGLAISPDDLDFSAAITECGIQGFKIDGSIDNTTDFGEWVDEILRCCRGQLYENNGKISVRIDAAAAAPSIHFDETGELGYNCIVDTWNEPERDAQTNRVRLSYSWNFENSNFNKKPSYNQESPLGDTHLQNATHAARIQKWNTETLEYKLIKDDTTAHKLAQYYLNNIVKQLITTSLTTEVDIPNTVDAGTVVKVTSPKFGWSEKTFRITSISRSEENTEIQLKEYDASVFTFYDPGTGAETSGSQYSVYNIPSKPQLTSLSVVNELLADGSTQTRINVNFVAPTENSQLVALYYKPSGGTEADFKPLDTVLSSAGTMSAIWKGIESGNYNFRLVTVSPVGIYSDLSIVSGDKHYYGQPGSEGTVALTGDTIAPGKPIIDDFLLVQGGVTLHFDITGGFPSDFSHFAVYRKLDGGSLLPLDMKYTGRLFTDTDVAGYVSRQYSIVAYDKSMNPSESSDLSVAMTPLKIATNDIQAGAITSETITSNAIYGKCFMTNCNVGTGVAGVVFDSAGIRAYSTTANTFNMDAMTGNVSMSGTICALAGNIGGFCADPTDGLYAGTGATRVQMKPGAGFWAGATAQVDAPFSVDQTGALKSISGNIGGWKITPECIAKSTDEIGTRILALNSSQSSIYSHVMSCGCGIWLGQIYGGLSTGWTNRHGFAITKGDNEYLFRADYDANGNNQCVQIAGWNFNNHTIYKNRTINSCLWQIGLGNWNGHQEAGYGDMHFFAGRYDGASLITIGNCLFTPAAGWVDRFGISVVSDSQQIFQAFSCTDGSNMCATIGGWSINGSQLFSLNCGIILCNNGAIQTGDFVTGNKGWKIYSIGNAEFNNICARGAIRTAVFIKDQISVVGGCTLIRPANVTCLPNYACSDYSFVFESTEQFNVGDIIRVKDGSNDWWGTVNFKNDHAVNATFNSGVYGWYHQPGQAVVNYGPANSGGIMLNGQAPYIDLYTHDGAPWNGTNSRVRIGNLNGWGTFDVDTYGIAAGCPTGQYMTYDSVSGVLNIKGNLNVGSVLPLSMPAGAVGQWSAKGGNTSSIALSGGVIDVSGNGNNAQAIGGVCVVNSSNGVVFSLDGIDDYIALPDAAYLAFGTGDFTISMWGNPSSVNELDTLIEIGAYPAGLLFRANSGYIDIYIGGANVLNLNYIRTVGVWAHYVLTRKDGYIYVYINGNVVASAAAPQSILTSGWGASIGRSNHSPGQLWNGLISTPAIFNRNLSAEEVKTLYLLGKESESGTITADRVKTGVLSSLNWNGSTVGSCVNMDNGTFNFGGGNLTFDGTTLTTKGTVCANAGCIGCFSLVNGALSHASCLIDSQSWNAIEIRQWMWPEPNTSNYYCFVNCIGARILNMMEYNYPGTASIYCSGFSQGSTFTCFCLRNTSTGDIYQSTSSIGVGLGFITKFVLNYMHNGTQWACSAYQPYGYCICNYNGNCVWLCSMYGEGFCGACALLNIYMVGGSSCYAMCTNGVIQASTFVGAANFNNLISSNSATPTTQNAAVTNGFYYVNDVGLFGQSDGALYVQAYDSDWIGQIYQDYRTGQLAVRGKRAGVWQGWSAVIDSSNIGVQSASIFNNMGQGHGTNPDFNQSGFGFRFFTNNTNGPGISGATQYYGLTLGLGSDYPFDSFASQLYWPRTPSGGNPYLSVRFREAGGWGAWSKIWAGYADSAYWSYSISHDDGDRNAATDYPNAIARSLRTKFVTASTIGTGGNYGGVITFSPWDGNSASTGDASYQLAFGSTSINATGVPILKIRNGIDTTWNIFHEIHHSGRTICNSCICALNGNSYGCPAIYASGCCGVIQAISSVCNAIYATSPWAAISACSTFRAIFGCSICNDGIVGCAINAYGIFGRSAYCAVTGFATYSYPVAGNGAYYNTSTRTLKQGFEDVDVLPGLRTMCIQKWTWADVNQRGFDEFIAPTAEDVASAFGLTFKDDGYYTLDGIALKAAQEIDQNVQVHDSCIEFLKSENIDLKSCVEQMSLKLKMIEERLGNDYGN